MSSIIDHLSAFMELPRSQGDLVLNESRSKLTDTFIVINDRPMFLNKVNVDYLEVHRSMDDRAEAMGGNDIKTLAFFLPESGCYMVNGNYEYLQKIAKRQWKRSFSWEYYSLSNSYSANDALQLFNQKPVSMFVRNGALWYNNLKIAEFEEGRPPEILFPEFANEVNAYLMGGSSS